MKNNIINIKKQILKSIILLGVIGYLFISFVQNTSAATLEIEPAVETLGSCYLNLDVYIDATGETVNAADIEIHYDNRVLSVEDQESMVGFQITEGDAFETYWGNISYNDEGRTFLTGGAFPNTLVNLSSRELFAQIKFKYTGHGDNTVPVIIRFDGIGDTLDSNIADSLTGDDLLTSVQNGLYTFAKDCRPSGGNPAPGFCEICPDCYECTGINLTPTLGPPLTVTPTPGPTDSSTPVQTPTPTPAPPRPSVVRDILSGLIPTSLGGGDNVTLISDDLVGEFDSGSLVKIINEKDSILTTLTLTCGLCLVGLILLFIIFAKKKKKHEFYREEFESNLVSESSKVELNHKEIINNSKDENSIEE